MTEYTPTTDDVREAYRGIILATDKPEVFELIDPDQADSEFDRWLDNVTRYAWARGYNEGYSTAEKRSKAGSQ